MVTEIDRSIFEISEVDALVNPVNAVGVSGAGLALQFKERWPGNYLAYADRCKRGNFKAGEIFVYPTGYVYPRYIINAATKGHWKDPSRLEYISTILDEIKRSSRVLGISRIAMPKIGCGLGGLKWDNVSEIIYQAFGSDEHVEIVVSLYEEESSDKNRRTRQNPGQKAAR